LQTAASQQWQYLQMHSFPQVGLRGALWEGVDKVGCRLWVEFKGLEGFNVGLGVMIWQFMN
jgi:hypothetical protein